tara:strand:+ start:1369 stop:3474 length:2106 start_codon:yes stop_codon:yes gene_type:complete
MSLKNLKSNLAARDLATGAAENLTYGKGRAYDRPGQDFSLEPFVKGGINLGGTTGFNSLTGGFIRGGALMHAERIIQDTGRFAVFLISGRGITWNAKQLGLQKSNPKVSEPAFSKSEANQRQWNFGGNTLAQIIGQGTGLHVKREGFSPLDKSGYRDEDKFLANYSPPSPTDGKSSNTNRLLYLFDNNISTDPQQSRFKTAMVNVAGTVREVPFADRFNFSAVPGQTHNIDGSPVAEEGPKTKLGTFIKNVGDKIKAAFKNPNEELYSYRGGPGSTYGLGDTNIYKYTNTNSGENLRYIGPKNIGFDGTEANGLFNVTNDILFESPKQDDLDSLNDRDDNYGILKGHPYDTKLGSAQTIPDIRRNINVRAYAGLWDIERDYIYKKGTSKEKTLPFKHNDTTGREGRANPNILNYLATLGKIPEDNYNRKTSTGRSYHRYSRVNMGDPGRSATAEGNTTVDLLNALDVFRSKGDFHSDEVRDLIRFKWEAVDSDDPTYSNAMVFRAFLDSMTDGYSATHNEFQYNGRAESFYTYNSFNRDIQIGFKIAAQSQKEMKPLYRKLNYLASNVAAEYSDGGRMRTPLMRLTVGAYHHRLPGVISNMNITWQKDYPWEIAMNNPEGGSTLGMYILPHVLDVSVTYKPIHTYLPQKSMSNPFIVPHQDMEIANSPGRKLWNSEGESTSANAAVAKRTKETSNAAVAND